MKSNNIIGLGLVSFFMQLGATLVFSTGNIIIADSLMSVKTLILVRSLAEAIPILIKLISGTISDLFENKKILLFIGYGGIIICKIGMLFSTFTEYFSISLLATVYIVSLFIDRMLNAMRDIPREHILIASSQDLHTSFGMRKIIGSTGSIIGGVISFILVLFACSGKMIYSLAIIPLIVANIILYKLVSSTKNSELSGPINTRQIYQMLGYMSLSNVIIYFIPSLSIGLGAVFPFERQSWKKNIICGLIGIICYFGTYWMFNIELVAALIAFNFTFFLQRLHASEFYQKVKINFNNKEFVSIGILSGLFGLGRINDTIYFTHGTQIGFDIKMTVIFFIFYYISMIIGSMLFMVASKRVSLFKYILLLGCTLLISNSLIAFTTNKICFLLSLFFVGCFSAGTELILQLLIGKNFSIARGTMYGYFYTINGIATIFNAAFIYKLITLKGISFAAQVTCIFPIILIIYLLLSLRRLK